jgi:transposase InsO family protein
VFGCLVCQRNKAQTVKKAGLLQPLSVPSFEWESVSMDFITQLPVTKSGYDAIAVFVDRLTKMVHFAPTYTDCSTRDVTCLLNDIVFKHHGLPSELISDRDPHFTSKFWAELNRLLGTKLKISTAFHPQTDGQTEKSNRVLEDYLRHYISPSQDDWDEWLPQAEFSVNNAWQKSIKNTPFMLIFGQQPRTPLNQSGGREVRVPQTKNFAETMADNLARAKASLLAA